MSIGNLVLINFFSFYGQTLIAGLGVARPEALVSGS